MLGTAVRVALYAEVNMNLIDGSSIWVQSVAQMLTTLPWVNVSVLLRSAEKRDVLTAPLREHPRMELIEPESLGHEGPLDPGEAMDCLLSLDSEHGFDVVMLRGRGVSEEICRADAFPGRLWVYYLPATRPRARQRGGAPAADRPGQHAHPLPDQGGRRQWRRPQWGSIGRS